MPKNHAIGGPTYAGHVDVSSPEAVAPEWAPAEPVTAPVEAVRPVEIVAEVESTPRKKRR